MNKNKVNVKPDDSRELEKLFLKDFNNKSKASNKKWRSHDEDCDCKVCNE